MNDKDKIIEEMAKDLEEFFYKTSMTLSFEHTDGKSDIITDKKVLKVLNDITQQVLIPCFVKCLTDLGYRKIPKDAVVLTVEKVAEYEKRLKEAWEKDIEQARKEMLKDCIESNKIAEQIGYEKGSKETAREIYDQLCGHGTTYVKKWIKEHFGIEIKE